ncbi:MAG: hypothetical protein ACXV7J_02080 [Methylomonas sp.]
MKMPFAIGFVLTCLGFLSGCTSALMQKSTLDNTSMPSAKAGKAQIVFMRPSTYAEAFQASVFDLKHDQNQLSEDTFIGMISASTKVLYDAEPGFHLFMVAGESADFMQANLKAGETYFALVLPRMEGRSAHFSLKPLHSNELLSDDYADWFESTVWHENTTASRQWGADNWTNIQDKKAKYLGKWQRKSQSKKDALTLKESDIQ